MSHDLESDDEIRQVLVSARTVAVLGAHPDASRPAFYVPDYLHGHGYRILPVNPGLGGKARLWGEPVRASLQDLAEPVDLVDVFRRSDYLPDHLDEILGMRPAPRVVWLQLGVRHDEVAARLREHGIQVVQDRCTMAEHRRLRLAPHR